MNIVAGSVDQVAVDAYGAHIFGVKPEEVEYIKIAHSRGLGKMNIGEMNIKHLTI